MYMYMYSMYWNSACRTPLLQILVPVRLCVLRPGLAHPNISNYFRRDAGRKLPGGARRLGFLYFEDVNGLFWGYFCRLLARYCIRLSLQVAAEGKMRADMGEHSKSWMKAAGAY